MARGDENSYDELFSYACPKFVTPTAPDFNNPTVNTSQEAYRRQLRLFLSEIRQQQFLGTIKQYLKLYTVRSHCIQTLLSGQRCPLCVWMDGQPDAFFSGDN